MSVGCCATIPMLVELLSPASDIESGRANLPIVSVISSARPTKYSNLLDSLSLARYKSLTANTCILPDAYDVLCPVCECHTFPCNQAVGFPHPASPN
jgi:hypothetical protein